jgi:hypothetical protein
VNINNNSLIFLDTHTGFDDWAALRFDMQGAPDFADGSSESSEASEEADHTVALALPQLVQIDITPGELPNSVNLRAKGRLPVAILSEAGFHAPEYVASDTLRFGRTGDEASLAFWNLGGEDVNGDGLLDLVCHFTWTRTGFEWDSVEGTLRGQTIWGKAILGTAPVQIVR